MGMGGLGVLDIEVSLVYLILIALRDPIAPISLGLTALIVAYFW